MGFQSLDIGSWHHSFGTSVDSNRNFNQTKCILSLSLETIIDSETKPKLDLNPPLSLKKYFTDTVSKVVIVVSVISSRYLVIQIFQ